MKKNKPFGELYYHSLKKIMLTTRFVVLLMILGILQVHASDTYTRKTLTKSSDQQQGNITGTVKDEKGNPLPGVTILVKGTTSGALSDASGKYVINNAPQNATLIFSFIGMATQEIPSNGQILIDVVLKEAAVGLDEVVVVGYGTQKKINLTGSVDMISKAELSNRQASTVSQLLQGLAPSLNFTIANQYGFQPGATMNITIRGIGSLNGGLPFTLIDGFPGDINNLNPEDIESVSVLKDASASAIYGARAAYGVILVTTKKGGKNEKISVTYTGTVSINTPPALPKGLDSYTWARVMNESGDNRGGEPFSHTQIDQIIAYQNKDWDFLRLTFAPGQTVFGNIANGNNWNNDASYANTNWWDVYYGHGVNQKQDLSVQGGTKNIAYYFSAGYLGQEGVLNFGDDKFKRINLVGKIDIAITDWWDFKWENRLTNKNRQRPHMTREGDYSFMFREIARTYPFVPLYDGLGAYSYESHIPTILNGGTDKIGEIDAWNNFNMEFRPLKGWKINAEFAYNFNQGSITNQQKTIYQHKVDNTWVPTGVSTPNNLKESRSNNNYWNANIYSSYNLNINNTHNVTILAGAQFERGLFTEVGGYKTNIIVEDIPSFQTATGTVQLWDNLSHNALEGLFSRINYNYKEKYLFETSVRYDGSYVFREGNRWGFFPSFSLGWNVHKEAFWDNLKNYINTLKVRATWGSLGNQNVSPYSDLELINLKSDPLNWIFNYGTTRPIGYTTAPGIVNKNLTWETATTKNIAVDMSFLNNRLTATAELYERLTTNMVGPSQAKPGVLGATVPQANNSTLRTRGWELTLDWKQSFANGISYFVGMNLSDYTSVVTKYFNPTGTLSTWYEGAKVGNIWGYTVKDLFRTQDELDSYRASVDLSKLGSRWMTGDLKYEDTNNDGKVNNGTNTLADHGDLSIIGNNNPRYLFGITAGMNFKGFDFSLLLRGVAKRELYFDREAVIFWGFHQGWWDAALQPRNLDYFRDQPGTKYTGLYEGDANINTTAYWPRPYQNGTDEAKNKNNPNTRYLQDASYTKLQNIQLGYSLPQSIVSKLKLQKLRVAFVGENLITFTKLPNGIDPVAPGGFYFSTQPVAGRLTYGADRIYSLLLSVTF